MTKLLCAQPSSVLFTSNIFLPQLTQHYIFMDKFFPQSRSNPWENHLASNKTRFLKQEQTPPEQNHWVRAASPSTVPCTSPQDTSPGTHAQLLATLLSLLPTDSSTVTQLLRITGEPGCLPQTNAHMPLFANSRVTQHQQPGSTPQQVLMHFCLFLAFNCSHGMLGSGWQPWGSVLSAHSSAPGASWSNCFIRQQPSAPEPSVRALRGWKNYREAQKHMRALETRGIWMRTDRTFEKRPSAFNHRAASPEGALAALPGNMPHLGVMNTGFCSITKSVILLIPCSAEAMR